ncbi:MAG: hypothetical protein GAK36_00297 [Pseudomonas sp.]|nr:MAG: hypothetical protein GAK36_00297 [Pseudomonas sp.]
MVGTIEHSRLQADQRIAGNNAVLHLLFDALLDGRDVFLRNHTAHDFVDEDQTFSDVALVVHVRSRETNPAMTELAATAGLANELAFDLDVVFRDGLAVGNLRLADVGLNAEFTLHAVDEDVQVQLTHTRDDGLAGFFVGLHTERRVFLGQLAEGNTHLLLVSLGLRLNSYRDYRLREVHPLEDDRLLDVAQGVTSSDVLHANQSSDVTSAYFFDLVTLVGVHLHHTTNALFLALHGVDNRVTRLQNAGIDANEGQSTYERVSGDLECQGRERSIVVSRTIVFRSFVAVVNVIRVDTLDRRDLGRSRQEVDNGVENQGHALVLERRAADSRYDFAGDSTQTQASLDLFDRQLTLFQVLVHQLFVGFGSSLDHVAAPLVGQLDHIRRNFFLAVGSAFVVFVPVDGLHLQQVNLTLEVIFCTDGQLNRNRSVAQTILDLTDDAQEVGAGTVHLVHVNDTRNTVLVGLTPYGFGLRLNAGGAAEHNDSAVQYAQGALNFNREVYVAGGVDDVYAVLVVLAARTFPEGGDRSGGDGDTTLLLLHHPVGSGGAVMHLTHLVAETCVEQDPLGSGGLARINVGTDTNVPIAVNCCSTSHKALAKVLMP